MFHINPPDNKKINSTCCFFRWDAAVCFQQAFHVAAINLSRDNIYSGGVSLEPTSIHPPIHPNTCCFDIVGSEQQTTWEKKKHRESHSRLSRSSTDDLDDIRPRGDIWEVWLPLLQLLRQPVGGNQEKNSPNMRFCTKCPHHTSLILIQLEGMIHHDSLYILTCEAALWLIVTLTLWKAATSTIQTWLCLCVLQMTGSYYSSCLGLTDSSWHEHEPRAHKKLKLCNNGLNSSPFAIKINLQRLEDIRQVVITINFWFSFLRLGQTVSSYFCGHQNKYLKPNDDVFQSDTYAECRRSVVTREKQKPEC